MKYRKITLINKGYKYIEESCNECTDDDKRSITLSDEWKEYYNPGRGMLRIGEDAENDIVIPNSGKIRIIEGCLKSEKGIYINGNYSTEGSLRNGDRILIGRTEIIYHSDILKICSSSAKVNLDRAVSKKKNLTEFPIYKRSPRIIKREPRIKIEIKPPKEKERHKKGELLKRVLPSIVMVCATVMVSILMKRGLFMMVMVAATGTTLAVTIVSYFDDKKRRKQEEKERAENYREYLLTKRKELYNAQKSFLESRKYHNLNLAEIAAETEKYTNRIYERSYNDTDFLTVSLGFGRQAPSYNVSCSLNEFNISKDPLYREMLNVYRGFSTVDGVPQVIDLKNAHLGIVGNREYAQQRLFDIMVQLSFFQSYHDVEFVVFSDEEDREKYDWVRWLPHARIHSINVSSLIYGENQRDQVLGHLNRIIKERSLSKKEDNKEKRFSPHYVFLVDSPKLLINHSIMEHLKGQELDLGYSLIFTTQIQNNLPENIRTILLVDAEDEGTLLMNEGVLENRKIFFDRSRIDYEVYARRLKPLVHNTGVTTQIPDNITFFDIYNAKAPEDIPIRKLWKENAPHKSLAVPLGVRGRNDIVSLNLHEKAHGPHGLVAGTTGSGKSEILQSYILSLAVNFHPYDVGFLLIDYKGGGMANLFEKLPHLLGTITNLDGSESMRALASIKSELRRRQDIFNKNGVNNINKYTEKFRAGMAKEPLPHLFLISDEFAELKKEQPEFMAELVSTARVGRSLGVHLILATQKPTGIVDDQIWSNARFKLCLKVQNEADSRELLKTGDAAGITQPGRAYLQVGNNEIYELFQSAYSGGAYTGEEEESDVDKRIYVLNELGQGHLINGDLSAMDDDGPEKITQLDAVIREIDKVYEERPYIPVTKPWLPPLEERIVNPEINMDKITDTGKINEIDLNVPVGIIDIPDRQSQETLRHDFNKNGNMGVFGVASTGKSTVLMNTALSLAIKNSPVLLNYYVLDFGNSALISLKKLPHTADYLSFDDDEKRGKFKKIIDKEILKRKKLFGREGVTSLEMYNRFAETQLPAIIIFIDNYDVIKEMGPEEEGFTARLTRDGVGVGIYTCIAASRSNAMKYAVFNSLSRKISNYMTEPSEIYGIVGRSKYTLNDIKGRALVKESDTLLMQEFLPAEGNDEIAYTENIRAVIGKIEEMNSGPGAEGIPMLPEKLEYSDLMSRKKKPEGIALGLEREEVDVRYLGRTPLQIIVGAAASGKTNVLKLIYSQIKSEDVFIVDSLNQEFYGDADNAGGRYAAKESDMEKFHESLYSFVDERERLYQESSRELRARDFYEGLPGAYLFINDVAYLAQMVPKDADLVKLFERAVNTGVNLYAAVNPKQLSGINNISRFIKSAQNGIILGKPSEQQLLPVGLYRGDFPEDEGLIYEKGITTRIKIPLCTET